MRFLLPLIYGFALTGCATTDPDFSRRLTETLNEMNNNPYVQSKRDTQFQPTRFSSPLTARYFQGGSQMCRYQDGTVLNIGVGLCPLSN